MSGPRVTERRYIFARETTKKQVDLGNVCYGDILPINHVPQFVGIAELCDMLEGQLEVGAHPLDKLLASRIRLNAEHALESHAHPFHIKENPSKSLQGHHAHISPAAVRPNMHRLIVPRADVFDKGAPQICMVLFEFRQQAPGQNAKKGRALPKWGWRLHRRSVAIPL
eukprot:961037-Pyramimonas_sp.AAC.1